MVICNCFHNSGICASRKVEYIYCDYDKLKQKRFVSNDSAKYDVDLEYNERDWLKSISAGKDDGAEKGKPREAQSNSYKSTIEEYNYNGNISRVNHYYQNYEPIKLVYSYDALNRLTGTVASEGVTPLEALPTTVKATNYNEIFNYKLDGRFENKWVQKYGGIESSHIANQHDYNYYSNSCRLKSLNTQAASGNYLYDNHGNMVYNAEKKMVIYYDWRNMPVLFTFYNAEITGLNTYFSDTYKGIVSFEELVSVCTATTAVKLSQVIMLYDANGDRVAKIEKSF